MRRLGLFAKPPVAGSVKTRLSPALPATLAGRLYEGLLRDALATLAAADAPSRMVWWASPPDAGADALVPAPVERALQCGDDLGARLVHAFERMLIAPGDRAVVIGADAPGLDAEAVRVAFTRLESHDLVLAPARDGGYTLIGLARPAPSLFEGVDWSTARVLDQTLARARAAGLSVSALETLDDLDTPADLVRWLGVACVDPALRAPHTRAALIAMGLLPARP